MKGTCVSFRGTITMLALGAGLLAVCAPSRAIADGDPGEGVAVRAGELTIAMDYDKARADLAKAEPHVVWTPPASGPYSHDIWAPELHFVRGKWYIYFAADAGTNITHRIYALENASADPTEGSWTFKGKVADRTDKWAIDATVFERRGRLYMAWSGWAGDTNGRQDIYLAELANPWTVKSERVLTHTIRSPFYTGPLRSPSRLQNTFAHESLMDEVAALVKADPVAYRLRHVRDERLTDVINAAAKAAKG